MGVLDPSRSRTAAFRERKSSSSWAVNVDVGCACERVSLLFAWRVDGLAIVGSARKVVYHRVTVVVVLVVVWLGVGRLDAIVVVVQEGQGKAREGSAREGGRRRER